MKELEETNTRLFQENEKNRTVIEELQENYSALVESSDQKATDGQKVTNYKNISEFLKPKLLDITSVGR